MMQLRENVHNFGCVHNGKMHTNATSHGQLFDRGSAPQPATQDSDEYARVILFAFCAMIAMWLWSNSAQLNMPYKRCETASHVIYINPWQAQVMRLFGEIDGQSVDGQMSKLYSIAIWFRKKSHDEQDLGLMESFDWKQTFSFIQVYTSAPPTIRLCGTLSAAINQIEQTHRSPVKKSINWRHHSTFNNHRRISFHKSID